LCAIEPKAKAMADALIKLHKSLVSTNQQANEALSRAAKVSNDGLSQLQKDISIARQRSQESMAKDMEASSSKAQAFIATLVEKLSLALQKSVGKMSSTVKDAESGVASLSKVGNRIHVTDFVLIFTECPKCKRNLQRP